MSIRDPWVINVNCATTATVTTANMATAAVSGVTWKSSKPANPLIGDSYYDHTTDEAFIYTGSSWTMISTVDGFKRLIHNNLPSKEELEKYPTLKSTWEEYMIVRKLLGLECGDTLLPQGIK